MMEFIKRAIAWYKRPNKSWFEEYSESLIVIVFVAFIIRTFGFGLYQVPTCSMETTMLVGERFFADKFTVLFKKPQRGDIISFNDPIYPYSKNLVKRVWQNYVWGPSNWTKRVVGMPGDHIQGKIEEGKPVVYLNGERLDEPYLNKYPIIYLYTGNSSDPFVRRSYDPGKPYGKQPFYRLFSDKVRIGSFYADRVGQPDILYPGSVARDVRGFQGELLDVFDVKLKKNQYWAMGDNRLGSLDSRAWGPLDASLIHGKIVLRLWSHDSDYSWWIMDLLKHPIDFWTRMRWRRCLNIMH